MDSIVILHISDLHFGIENDKSEKTKYVRIRQREIIDTLIHTLSDDKAVPKDWKPNVIVISGDIAWSGQDSEYQLYKENFVKPLTTALGISDDYIITCPGNHDIIRDNVEGLSRLPVNQSDSDVKEINRKNIKNRKSHFDGYVKELCNDDPNQLCKLYNYPQWPWISFLSLNSAWDCRDDNDEGRLRVSLPLLEDLVDKLPEGNEHYVISIFHHPHTVVTDNIIEYDKFGHRQVIKSKKRQWLHISECEPDIPGSRCFTSYLEDKSTFILNGHIHKETAPQKANKAFHLISGTLYSNDTPKYHCRLLKVSKNDAPEYCDLRCTIGDSSERFEVTTPKGFHFEHAAITLSKKNKILRQNQETAEKLDKAIEQYENNPAENAEQLLIAAKYVSKLLHGEVISKDKTIETVKTNDESIESNEHNNIYTIKNRGD